MSREAPEMTSIFNVCDPFVRAANILDALPNRELDDQPLRDMLPGTWPTYGDLRKLRDELVRQGWTREWQRP